jgi:membrane protein YqaA with SNARE-associated domain
LSLADNPVKLSEGWNAFTESVSNASAWAKLLVLGIYLSLCCTFLPLNTSWIVAAVAADDVSVGVALWDTVILVAIVGGIGSTIGNLHDYHLFRLLLRNRSISKVKDTKLYDLASRWFEKSPFFALLLFNIIPIPIDVARMLAAGNRYPRTRFVVANFAGRAIRYGTIAFLIYQLQWNLKTAAIVMLSIGAAMLIAKLIVSLVTRRPEANSA